MQQFLLEKLRLHEETQATDMTGDVEEADDHGQRLKKEDSGEADE